MNLRRFLLAVLTLLPALALAVPYAPGNPAGFTPVEGEDFTTLGAPVPTTTGNKLEVREFFFYGCSHCFHFEPALNAWLKRKPADVEFVRTPAILNSAWEPLGRAYFVAQELGLLEKIHDPLYNAIHGKGQRISTREKIAEFFAGFGVKADRFDAAWSSMKVETSVKNAGAISRKYMIEGTPTLTVAGKYVVGAGQNALATVDYLLKLERERTRK